MKLMKKLGINKFKKKKVESDVKRFDLWFWLREFGVILKQNNGVKQMTTIKKKKLIDETDSIS